MKIESQEVTPDNRSLDEFNGRFIREAAEVIDVDGMAVRRNFPIASVSPRSVLSIRFLKHVTAVPQAFCLSVTKGKIQYLDEKGTHVILWADTAPTHVNLQLTNRVPCLLRVWNVWRADDGTIETGSRYAGLVADRVNSTEWIFRCSDGVGDADFEDLIVSLKIGIPGDLAS